MVTKIKELREKQGLTQTDLANKSGVSRATIWALENGTARSTTTKTLFKVATALNTTVDNIFFVNRV